MPSKPLITVGMPVYNGERYLRRAVESVLAQTYRDWELILVDDCSTDRSLDTLGKFKDDRIRVLSNATNQGLVRNRNRIMREAQGRYLAWLDQDDVAYPHRLARQLADLMTHPETSICGGWTNMRVEQDDGHSVVYRRRTQTSSDDVRAQMIFSSPLMCNTVIMDVEPLTSAGLQFRSEFGNALDYDMWSNASDSFVVRNIRNVLGEYRVHSGQTSQGDELVRMNASSLVVQTQFARRWLGMDWTAEEMAVHQRVTLLQDEDAGVDFFSEAANWLRILRRASLRQKLLDREAFDLALARQWVNVLRGGYRNGIPPATLVAASLEGVRTIGVSGTSVGGQLLSGVTQAIERSRAGRFLTARG